MKLHLILLLVFFVFPPFFFSQNTVNANQGFTEQKNYLLTIPYEEVKGKIIVDVIINNKNRKFILDTGAATTISEQLFKELNPKQLGKVDVADQSGLKDSARIISLPTVKINDLIFRDIPAMVLSKNPIFECFGVEGFIGSNLLRNSIVQFNSKDKTITLTDDPKSLNLKKKYSNEMELSYIQSNPFIWIKLKNGNASANEKILFDTGDDGLYMLSINAYKQISGQLDIFQKLAESKGTYSVGMHGTATTSQNFIVNIPTLEVNDLKFNNVTAKTTYANTSRFGSEILSYGKVSLDYKNKRFYIEPFEDVSEIALEKRIWAVDPIIEKDKAVVGIIWDKTLESKINVGDQILKFDDIDYQNLDFCTIFKSGKKVNKKSAILVLKDAKTSEVKSVEVKKL
jgi:hypothetical protein